MTFRIPALGLAMILGAASPSTAQTVQPEPSIDRVEDIVVTARRSGAPLWRIRNGGATVIIVGSLSSVPADTPWRPEALEAAVAQADSVILSQTATMSLGDFMRLRRARARLPEGRTTADYLPPEWQARLSALGRTYRRDYSERGLTWIAGDLTGSQLRYRPGTGRSADAVVKAAARKIKLPVNLVGDMDGRHIDDELAVPDAAQVACLTASIEASEAGVEAVRARGLAWTRQDVPTVVANPVERAHDRCQWFADETLITEARAQWSKAVADALTQDQTIMVVAPISMIAEPGGVLDQLEARGLEVDGPVWKAGQ